MEQAPNTSLLPPSPAPAPAPAPKPSSAGPIIGIIIVIIVLGLGALYFWGARLNERVPNDPPLIPGDETAAMQAELETQTEADVRATESSL